MSAGHGRSPAPGGRGHGGTAAFATDWTPHEPPHGQGARLRSVGSGRPQVRHATRGTDRDRSSGSVLDEDHGPVSGSPRYPSGRGHGRVERALCIGRVHRANRLAQVPLRSGQLRVQPLRERPFPLNGLWAHPGLGRPSRPPGRLRKRLHGRGEGDRLRRRERQPPCLRRCLPCLDRTVRMAAAAELRPFHL